MDRTGLFLFRIALGKSLWLQLCRNFSSRNWAGASRRVCSLSGAQTYWDGLIGAGFSISWRGEQRGVSCLQERVHSEAGPTSDEDDTHHEFRFDQEVIVSPNWNVLLHHVEVVEATQQEPTAVHPEVEVHLLTTVPARGQKTAMSNHPDNAHKGQQTNKNPPLTYRLRSY